MVEMSQAKSAASTEVDGEAKNSYNGPLVIVTLLFFMWGFITCMNDILIPKLQDVFTLQNWQAMLIQTAFFGAYFLISLLYFIFSVTKGDPINRIGYKNGIITGLVVTAAGCVLFYPAADFESYAFFLIALFVLASGITILQIAANPYVAILGPPETASSRLNMTQALNSLGTTVAPLIGGYLIFDQVQTLQASSADAVKLPYIGLAVLLLLIAALIKISRLPHVTGEKKIIADAGALKHPHLVLGIICIFMYVGGEVSIGSALINFFELPHIAGFNEAEAKHYLAFYWGGAMIGRFFGAVMLGHFKKNIYKFSIIGLITLLTFITVYSVYGLNLSFIVLGLIIINLLGFLLGSSVPNKTLGFFAFFVIVLLLLTSFADGQVALWSVIAIGLFNSIMFPTIFTLAIRGLGIHTTQGSSLLVMAIVGGAIIPPLQGLLADITGNLQLSFLVPMACYIFIVYYGFIGYKPKQIAKPI